MLLSAGVVVALCVWVGGQTPPAAKPAAPLSAAQVAKNAALEQRFGAGVLPILKQHCYGCHGGGKKKGDFTLDRFTSLAAIRAERKVWTSVADILNQRTMPPENKPRPSDAEYQTLLAWVDEALEADC